MILKKYKYVLTKNGKKYVGEFLDNGNFKSVFGWQLPKEDIAKEITWFEYNCRIEK